MTDLRTRAAVAVAGLLFGFNPHQRRGPDGRWIKMTDSELKRPRRPAKPTVRTEDHPLYRRRRETYNQRVINIVNDNYAVEPQYSDLLYQLETAEPGERRDGLVDRLKDELRKQLGEYAPLPPEPSKQIPIARGRARGGPRPGIDQPYTKRRAALQRSVDSGAVEEIPLAQGMMGETIRYQLGDGTEAIYKRALKDQDYGYEYPPWTAKDQMDAEELTAILAQALGVSAPAVTRPSDDAIYMDVMPGQVGEDRWPTRRVPPGGILASTQGVRMGLLDTLIENTDRHGGNYLIDDADNLYAIDHGLAFHDVVTLGEGGQHQVRPRPGNRTSSFFATRSFVDPRTGDYFPENGLTPSDVAQARRRLGSVRAQFERLGRMDWFEAAQRRLDEVARRADGSGGGIY